MKFSAENPMSWPEFWRLLIFGIPVCIVGMASRFGANALARRLGYPGELGESVSNIVLMVISCGVMVWWLYPLQGRAIVYRVLSFMVFCIAFTQILPAALLLAPRSQWTTRSISLCVLAGILLILQLIWVVRRFPLPSHESHDSDNNHSS